MIPVDGSSQDLEILFYKFTIIHQKTFIRQKRVCWGAYLRYCHLDFDEKLKTFQTFFFKTANHLKSETTLRFKQKREKDSRSLSDFQHKRANKVFSTTHAALLLLSLLVFGQVLR
jgi:hypothetical protein